jgi:sodium transport system permease protein
MSSRDWVSALLLALAFAVWTWSRRAGRKRSASAKGAPPVPEAGLSSEKGLAGLPSLSMSERPLRTPAGVLPFVRKEFREFVRNRLALMFALSPVFFYPLIFSFTGSIEKGEEERARERRDRIAVTGQADLFREAIAADEKLEVAKESEPEQIRLALRSRELEAWLDVPAGVSSDSADLPEIRIVLYSANARSEQARTRLVEMVERVRLEERERRYREAGGDARLDDALGIREIDVATAQETGGARTGRILPYLLIMTLFMTASSFASEIVAGEKERGTLETLILAPVSRELIARAKLLVVTGAVTVFGLLSVGSILFCYRMGFMEASPAGSALVVPGEKLPWALFLVLPLGALVSGIVLGISSYARTVKEAQYYVMPASLLAFVPGLLAIRQGVGLDFFTALLPVASVALAVRDSLLGEIRGPTYLLAAGSTIVWAWAATRWAARLLSREESVLGFDPEPILAKTRSGRRRAVLLGMACSVLLYFYAGTRLQAHDLLTGIALSLWVVLPLLGAATLKLAWNGGRIGEILSLRRVSPLVLLGGILLGVGTVVPMFEGVFKLQELVLPVPKGGGDLEESMKELGMPLLLLLFAFSPGVSEELMFRGVFLGLLRRAGTTRAALLLSAVYFALIHLSVFRLVPTFLLGLILAGLTISTGSIFPAMAFHMAYNGLAFGLGGLLTDVPPWVSSAPAWAGSVALLAAGFVLVRGLWRRSSR